MENKCDLTGFFVACRNADIKTAKVLLELVDQSRLAMTLDGRTCFHLAVIAGDADLLQELAAKLRSSGLINTIEEEDRKGDTALHLAVRKNRVDLMKQLIDLNGHLFDRTNKEGETPLNIAVRLGFKKAVKCLISRTSNALHYIVELNQVKLIEYLYERKVDLSNLINQPYQPTFNPLYEGGRATNPHHVQQTDGESQHHKEKGHTNSSADEGYEISHGNGDTNPQQEQSTVTLGDTPLHIAARNKYEHMVNLLLKVPEVNKLALNSEDKTPFDVAREVIKYHESFRIIKKLEYSRGRPKPFMYCAPQVSHKKRMEARKIVEESYKTRRDAELVVAALLAAMTSAAAFTVPGGFESEDKRMEELGSPILISFTSFKLFLVFDCIAFFLSLFVCIMWEMSSELTTGNKMLFMTVNSLVVCCSFGFTAYGFMCAVYAMLARKVKTLAWVVLGSLIAITLCGILAFIRQSVHFVVTRARFHRLCGESLFLDNIVEKVWSRAERCGLLNVVRSGEKASLDLITGHAMIGRPTPEHEDGRNNSHSSSPFLNSRS